MDFDDETNPFADSSVRKTPAASSFSNQQASNESNPFANTTVPARPAQPPQQSFSAVLPSTPQPVYQPTPYQPPVSPTAYQPTPYQPPVSPTAYQPTPYQPPVQPAVFQPTPYQPPSYASTTAPIAAQQATEKYGNDPRQASTNVDLGAFDRQQAELAERERRLAQREQELKVTTPGNRVNNFPPLPKVCPCGPCFYQDISVDIPAQFQLSVRHIFYLWILYSITLFLNVIAALSYFLVDKDGASSFGLSLVFFILFIPMSYACWFRPVYRAFREDSASSFMIFFLVFFMQIIITILQFFGVANLGCGFARIGLLSTNTAVGAMMIILGGLWSIISVAAIFLTIRVHRLYRKSGASLEQAQKEFQTAFVNNATVRGAAREVATAGINEALRST